MFQRLCKPLKSNSFFLFGARGTGKSTLINSILGADESIKFNLLDEQLCQQFLARPHEFYEQILASKDFDKKWVIVDEVQRAPKLLNYVHMLIEDKKIKFALTGSSARKLKHGGANLLAGRAFVNNLYPLTSLEMKESFNLKNVLHYGSLPFVINSVDSNSKIEFLKSYVATYIKEEIKEEQLVRKIEPFIHFLEIAAQMSGSILNFSKIAKASGNESKNVERYYEILKDTLLGFELTPFDNSVRKRQFQKSKFYFFDYGVKRAIDRSIHDLFSEGTSEYGNAFEHFFILECYRLNDYLKKDFRFHYIRTKDDVEIDLLIEKPNKEIISVEIKSAKKIDDSLFGNAVSLNKKITSKKLIVACNEVVPRETSDLRILPWKTALEEIFEL